MPAPLVMIVDDESGLLLLFRRLVEQLGCAVIALEGGAEAISVLREETPNLLILDWAMPEVSGEEVLRFVDSIPELDSMQVMVLTATGPGPAPADVDGRIDAWVLKPILPAAFLDEVRQLLRFD